jgi:GntR family transcriptional regulator, transcriptional repressor for pyruvate dehydrogenase complex
MFRRARQNRVYQDVVGQIQKAVLEGRLKIGDRLPAERDLTELFKASRGTIREALRVLEQKGLIAIKLGVGGGAIIKGVTTDQMSESLGLLVQHRQVSLDHLAEFREGIEGLVAAFAAQRATKQDVDELRGLLAQAHDHLTQGISHWASFIRVDEQIHLALSRITGNPLFASVLKTVHENIHRYYESFLPGDEAAMRENYQDLADIVGAVAQGRGAQAAKLARSHVLRFNRRMREKQQRDSKEATRNGEDGS